VYGGNINKNLISCYKICKFWIVLDFATTVEIFIYFPAIIVGCSDIGEVENIMTDNPKVKASKAVDDARVAAYAVYDDATVAAHNILKDAGVEAQKVSDDVKIGVHKVVSDANIAAHEAGSTLKKR
jgi:hypothetical protein